MEANGLQLNDKDCSYCVVCGIADTIDQPLRNCSRCKCAKYCCVEHQKNDFAIHKKYCKQIGRANSTLDNIGNIDAARNLGMMRRSNQQDEQIIDNMKARVILVDAIVCMAYNATVPYSNVRYLYRKALDLLIDMFATDQGFRGITERLATVLLLLGFDEYCEGFYHVILDHEHCLKLDANGTQLGCEIWSKPDFLHQVFQFWKEGRAETFNTLVPNIPGFEALVFLLIEHRKEGTKDHNAETYQRTETLETKLSPGLLSMMIDSCNQENPTAVDYQIADHMYAQTPTKTPIEYWLLLKKCSSSEHYIV